MERNKVIFNGEVLIDLTEDSVSPAKVLLNETFHDKTGVKTTGTCTYDADTKDATATKDEILAGKTAYRNGAKITGEMPNNGAISRAITTLNSAITVPYGFHDGSGTVGIDATEKAKIKAENIRDGVTILGVKGTLSEGTENPEPKRTVTPSTSVQTITPASGYTCLREVVVNAIPYSESQNASGGMTVTIGQRGALNGNK